MAIFNSYVSLPESNLNLWGLWGSLLSQLRPPKDLGNGTNNLGIGTRDQITLELSHWWMLGKAGQD